MGDSYKIISKLYKLLLKWFTKNEAVKEQMIKWAININSEIEMDQWENLWRNSIRISMCTAIQENCYKVMYQWYMTPKKLAKIHENYSNRCWKCKEREGSYVMDMFEGPKHSER